MFKKTKTCKDIIKRSSKKKIKKRKSLKKNGGMYFRSALSSGPKYTNIQPFLYGLQNRITIPE